MKKRYGTEAQIASGRRTLAIIAAALIITVVITNFLPASPSDYGFMSVMPALFLIVYIFTTRRILEALILASVLGLKEAEIQPPHDKTRAFHPAPPT